MYHEGNAMKCNSSSANWAKVIRVSFIEFFVVVTMKI